MNPIHPEPGTRRKTRLEVRLTSKSLPAPSLQPDPPRQSVESSPAKFDFRSLDWLHEPLRVWLGIGEGATPAHCDSFTLHRPGRCTVCDQYAMEFQQDRISRGIPFSDEPGAPDALFRPASSINRWGGNIAKPKRADCTCDCGHPAASEMEFPLHMYACCDA